MLLTACGIKVDVPKVDSEAIVSNEIIISLKTPASSPSNDDTPEVTISGLAVLPGHTVRVFSDSTCATQISTGVIVGSSIDLTSEIALTDGTYSIHANVTDLLGQTSTCSTNSVTFQVDTLAPSVTGLSDDATPRQSKTFSWGCNEICTYDFLIDQTPNTIPASSFLSTTSTSQSSGTGTYYIHVMAKDAAGNVSAVSHASAEINNTSPTLALTSPADNSYINSSNDSTTFTVSGTCSENTRVVTVNVDGSPVATTGGTCNGSTFTSTIDSTAIAAGVRTLTATYTNAAGNPGTSAGITVTRNISAPTIAITTPATSSYINIANDSTTFTVSGTCSENTRVVTVNVDGSAVATTGGTCNGATFTSTIDSTVIAAGVRTLTATYTNTAGNPATSAGISVTRDVTAPSSLYIALKTPASSPGNSTTPTFTVNNVAFGDTVRIYTGSCILPSLKGTAFAAGTSVDFTSSAISGDGDYVYYADATDAAGNTSDCTPLEDTYTYSLVTSSFFITSVTVLNGTYGRGQTVNFIANFSRSVIVSGLPFITLTVGSTSRRAVYASGSGSSSITFSYTVPPGDSDTDGIEATSPVVLNDGAIQDSASNDATLSFTSPTTTSILVNSTNPAFTELKNLSAFRNTTGSVLTFRAKVSEDVNVTGTPRIRLTIGSSTRYATYDAASSTTTRLNFKYAVSTIASGDFDSDGIDYSTTLELNGGTILDFSSNPVLMNLPSVLLNPPSISVSETLINVSDMAVTAGDNQTAVVNNFVANSPQVRITDTDGNGIAGINVTFSGSGKIGTPNTFTNSSGYAFTTWKLGTIAGGETLFASAKGFTTATFQATANPGAAFKLSMNVPEITYKGYYTPPRVTVTVQDKYGNTSNVSDQPVSIFVESSDNNAFLVGTTSQNLKKGIAIFNNFTFSKEALNTTLRAEFQSLSILSNPFKLSNTDMRVGMNINVYNGSEDSKEYERGKNFFDDRLVLMRSENDRYLCMGAMLSTTVGITSEACSHEFLKTSGTISNYGKKSPIADDPREQYEMNNYTPNPDGDNIAYFTSAIPFGWGPTTSILADYNSGGLNIIPDDSILIGLSFFKTSNDSLENVLQITKYVSMNIEEAQKELGVTLTEPSKYFATRPGLNDCGKADQVEIIYLPRVALPPMLVGYKIFNGDDGCQTRPSLYFNLTNRDNQNWLESEDDSIDFPN